jgi:hypothetical protein
VASAGQPTPAGAKKLNHRSSGVRSSDYPRGFSLILSITSSANLADTVAVPPPISMATSMASMISSKDAPSAAV